MKIEHIWIVFFCVTCMTMSCNDPVGDKYQKILKSHPTIMSHTLPDYYLNLFRQNVKGKIKLTTSLEHIGRDTVCDFLYDQKYYIALYTLSQSYDSPLKNSLKESFNENGQEFNIPFYENEINFVGISHRLYSNANENRILTNIFISFGGSGYSEIEKNDTIADYFFDCKNLSIKYKVDGPQEVFVNANGDKPLEIIFLKKERNLFLIFITAKKDPALFSQAIGKLIFK